MKHIISLLISISLLFPYTALSYSYNVENWEVEAENIWNTEHPQAQLIILNIALGTVTVTLTATVVIIWGVLAYCTFFEYDCVGNEKDLKTSLILACNKLHQKTIEPCVTHVNQMNRSDLSRLKKAIDALQKLPLNIWIPASIQK